MKLVSADGRNLAQFGTLVMKLNAGDIQTDYPTVIEDRLSVPIILDCDFLMRHGVFVYFNHHTFKLLQES